MGYIMELRETLGSRPLLMPGACVLVRNEEGHLLLQKRSDSFDWGTLGGALELGESLEEAAARELQEEAGLTAKAFQLIALLSGQDMYYRYPHGDEVYNVMAVYEAVGVEGIPTVNDDEGLELKYFALDQPIPDLNPFTELVLRKIGYLN
ncbi:NUDIX domain-containing protein [Paenibacillus aurantius]|uniref:NUDIX domain-containing protein n=1 Tax=Paenibacillus aurantius TaxID=2918900 RepID=A0AA96RK05_9BACL|nr:NUDIX domain-containing protein [Paenibacillus aurantius]WNQ13844.1 NUDIX domain-containing protein [Paenibacillus aurantius]